ncbi:MAG TPA: response regulator [Candidatus Limnocylindrales bacterium]|nr:response regulator [Candidatus Limnocylindrales bacterium]
MCGPDAIDVLIVDDNLMLAQSIREMIELSGSRCALAGDGQAALAILNGLVQPPRAIVCDLVMPRMDGFELLQALRADARWRGIFIVVASGRDDDRAPALSMGADVFLSKPFPIHRLIELVSSQDAQA